MQKILQKIFSITNENTHKLITVLGIKVKFKKRASISQLSEIESNLKAELALKNDFINQFAIDCYPYEPHSVNVWGSFKEYALKNNMPSMIATLKTNLDEKSVKLIDDFLLKSLLMPEETLSNCCIYKKDYLNSLYSEENLKNKNDFYKNFNDYKNKFNLSCDNYYSVENFLFHGGLTFCNEKMINYIKNKDFIDGGAFIGDSVLVFNKYYQPKRIFSFELSQKTAEKYNKTMADNNIEKNKYELVIMGLSDKDETIQFNDCSSPGTSILNNGKDFGYLTSIDNFCKNKDLDIGFIKLDVEGQALKAVKGALETIKKYRPILSIAIYHSPEEFFKVKPLLESINNELNYKFEIKHLHFSPYVMIEYVLFAYPAELQD